MKDILGGNAKDAPSRLNNLINQIFAAVPDTVLIVSTVTLIPSVKTQIDIYNQAITALVNKRKAAGQHILLASMDFLQPADIWQDNIHPNDGAFVGIARSLNTAIQEALKKGWLAAR